MLEKLVGDEHSGLLLKLVNYGQKRFITFSPGPNVINLFAAVIYEFSY
jgi:hypothetical protein